MKGYKTLVVNGALAVLPAVDYVLNHSEFVTMLLRDHAEATLSVIGLVNVVLRWVTTTPVMKAE